MKNSISVNRQSSGTSRSEDNSSDSEHPFIEGFKQQMLKAWLPIPSLTKTIVLFFIMTFVFLGVGIPMLILSNTIVETKVSYDTVCAQNQLNCALTINVQETIHAPVFVYLQLRNFYQNHRLYANSISYNQLEGGNLTVSDIQTLCKPIVTNADLWVNVSLDGTPLNKSAPANPCGMVAYTMFNDTFDLQYPNSTAIPITTDGIAWPSDVSRYSKVDNSTMWLDVSNPRFMNWIRIATMSSFRKLWGKITTDLQPGTYTLKVNNLYTVKQFGTEKYFVLSTSNFFGARNQFLSIIYLVMGVLCLIVAVSFCVKKIRKDRNEHHD